MGHIESSEDIARSGFASFSSESAHNCTVGFIQATSYIVTVDRNI